MPPIEDTQNNNDNTQLPNDATATELVPPEASADAGSAEQQTTDSLTDLPTDKPASQKMLALLDELSADEKPAPKSEESEPEQDPDAEPAPKGKVDPVADPEPKTLEQEEAELLDGVKSDRGRERIREVFAQKKQLEQDIHEFRELVTSTGMSPEQFAQTLEFGRLINAGTEQDLRVALEMIEQQRSVLYQRLGVEAPGVDLLTGHDDLKQAVDNMEITRERALELAKYRKQDAENRQRQQVQQQSQVETQQFQQTVQQAAGAMEAYLTTRAQEADHPVRMKAITEHFKNPANLQAFVQTYQPHQWVATLKMMYDGVVVPKQATVKQPQPLHSRPSSLGSPSVSGNNPIDRIAAHMDNLGL